MLDVIFIAALIAFFALMVAFVHWCERIVGKEDVSEVGLTDDDVDDGPATDRTDSASTIKTPEEVTS
ncbi:MAG: hypothetical protein ACLPR9_01230 [Acidimicrobiales bacterium]|jgi:hypothetical protein